MASQCYPALDAAALAGQVTCLTKVSGGYCTHTCATDSDCCAVAGECNDGRPEVCSPFESTDLKYCFLGCEDATIAAAGVPDGSTYCSAYASANFVCRSTGGGSQNRKVCAP